MKTALITGIGGQDGSYLAELLLDQGYAVHGLVRRSSGLNRERIDDLRAAAKARGRPFELHYGNLIDPLGLQAVIGRVKPDEIYNLASESHVGISFDEPEYSTSVNAVGVVEKHVGRTSPQQPGDEDIRVNDCPHGGCAPREMPSLPRRSLALASARCRPSPRDQQLKGANRLPVAA
jgi:NAD(P)-dependent dehydrogenase (short-subunit alcohol dehydrogenase family)